MCRAQVESDTVYFSLYGVLLCGFTICCKPMEFSFYIIIWTASSCVLVMPKCNRDCPTFYGTFRSIRVYSLLQTCWICISLYIFLWFVIHSDYCNNCGRLIRCVLAICQFAAVAVLNHFILIEITYFLSQFAAIALLNHFISYCSLLK